MAAFPALEQFFLTSATSVTKLFT